MFAVCELCVQLEVGVCWAVHVFLILPPWRFSWTLQMERTKQNLAASAWILK